MQRKYISYTCMSIPKFEMNGKLGRKCFSVNIQFTSFVLSKHLSLCHTRGIYVSVKMVNHV